MADGFGGVSGALPSVMGHRFSQVPAAEIERSQFDRSHGLKLTGNGGYLYPVLVDEVLPGDTFNDKMTTFIRLQTPIHPYMDNMYAESFFFFVPNRLLWTNWEKMNGSQVNPGDSTSFLVPQITSAGGWAESSLGDYLGFPTKKPLTCSALWTRAYNLIWNQWFRDENLQNSVTVDTGDGPDSDANYVLLRRGKRHDYFTSCLPWPQKGTAVALPLGTTAPVLGLYVQNQVNQASGATGYGTNSSTLAAGSYIWNPVSGANLQVEDVINATGTGGAGGHMPNIRADLSNATAATINALRLAFQTQRMLERDARGGTRYTEVIKAHFGVTSPDARLQRPEYLGGGRSSINVHPVPQTSGTSGSNYQGNLAAFATSSGQHGFTKSFTEHGVLLGLLAIHADLNYQQGLDRMFSRRTRFDYFWPALAHLGEQSVLNKEIYYNNDGNDGLVFGYQERYAEYRFKPSRVAGQFRSNAASPLDMWHLAENFGSLPVLGATFIVSNPPINRIVADTADAQFYIDIYHEMRCVRPMPVYSVPGLIDHF